MTTANRSYTCGSEVQGCTTVTVGAEHARQGYTSTRHGTNATRANACHKATHHCDIGAGVVCLGLGGGCSETVGGGQGRHPHHVLAGCSGDVTDIDACLSSDVHGAVLHERRHVEHERELKGVRDLHTVKLLHVEHDASAGAQRRVA
jgi:hypothetical protein